MHRSPTTLSMAACLALAATAAAAAPAAKPSGGGPKPQAECPVPDEARCLEKGYLDSKCGQKHLAVCKPFAVAAMQDHYEAKAAPKVKMLRPRLAEMPQHVVSGKYYAYKKVPLMKKQGSVGAVDKVYRKAGDVLKGVAGMDMSATPPVDRVTTVDPNEAAQFHRNPAWKTNGIGVRSCKEYAYARSYGATRFIDAASACRGDRECVFAVAYMNAPTGIAGHKLHDEAGVQMARQLVLPTGKKPKNDMFVAGMDEFIKVPGVTLPNGMTAQPTEIAALKSALRAGKEFYELGLCSGASCNATRRFASVWDWHKYLHNATVVQSQAEAEEYERRRAKFRALIEQWGAAVNKEKSAGQGMQIEQPIVLPFDMRTYDPFERFDREREYIERGRDTQKLFKQRFGAEIFEVPRSEAMQKIQQKQMQGAWQPAGGGMALGLLAAPTPVPASQPAAHSTPSAADTAMPVDAAPWLSADSPSISKCLATEGWGLEMAYKGPLSCRIEEFLLGEWRRKAAGQKSCLDLNNPGCDWTPQMFEVGVLEQVQRLDVQVSDEAYCTAYLEPSTFTDDPQNGGVSTVTVVKARLDATRARVEKELKAVSDYLRPRTAIGQRLGKDWEGGDLVGDKNWFAAGYDYGVGWDVAPAAKNNDGLVCQLAGSAHGDVGFDAWIVGSKIPVVDGAVWAEARPADGGDGGDARFNAHLEMMGQSVFNTNGWKLAQTFSPDDDAGWAVQIPGGVKPRFDIYVGVPISGQLWGELMFGSTLGLSGKGSNGCEPGNPKFAIAAQYMPFFGAFGVGQVGVGIAGIASAGIRAALTLVMIGLPVDVGMQSVVKGNKPTVSFTSELSLMLVTLAGRVSLYVEFLMFDEEFELFRWKGFSTSVPLMPKLTADVSLVGLK